MSQSFAPERRVSSISFRKILILVVALPLLYVLSSGPALSFAFTWHQPTVQDDGDGNLGVTINLDEGPWWPVIYAPLQWVSEQSWGEWLCWYWERFPISTDQPRKPPIHTPAEAALYRPTPKIRLEPSVDRVDPATESPEPEVKDDAGSGSK